MNTSIENYLDKTDRENYEESCKYLGVPGGTIDKDLIHYEIIIEVGEVDGIPIIKTLHAHLKDFSYVEHTVRNFYPIGAKIISVTRKN